MTAGRSRSIVLGIAGAVAAAALVGYGVWSRTAAVADLQHVADDAALIRVELTKPKPDTQSDTLRLPGEIAAWNDASIYGQVSGYITHWYKDIGASVTKDEVLASIAAPSLDAQYAAAKANLDVAQAGYNLAELTAKRYQELSHSNGVSQQDIDNRVAAAAQQKAQLASAQETVNQFTAQIGFEKVIAPFDGVVTARNVNIGDLVTAAGGDTQRQAAQPLFRVADVHKLRVFVSIPQSYGALLRPGLVATLTPYGDPAHEFKAAFLATANSVSRATRTINTEFVLDPPPKALQPGAYVTVTLQGLNGNPDSLTIPSQAVIFRAEGPQAALVDTEGTVHLRPIVIGRDFGLTIQILKGLTTDDSVVANPSLGLLDGQKVKVVTSAAGYQPGTGKTQP